MKNHPGMRAFIRLSRLKFLVGGLLGFALGVAIARFDGFAISWLAYLHGQVMVSAFHLMIHYSNDYFDRFCDERTVRTPWSGGSGALTEDGLRPGVALAAAIVCAFVGVASAIVFWLDGNSAAALTGIASGILGWAYSAPPVRLLARGWGELDVALIVAVLFPLAGYLTFAPAPSVRLFVSVLPAFAAMWVLMFGVEYPDVEADRETGKLNLIARSGRTRARAFVYAAVLAIYAGSALGVLLGATPFLEAFVLLTLPIAWPLFGQLAQGELASTPINANIAARCVALFVVTALGSVLAYVAAIL